MGRGRGGRENGVAREPGTHLAHSTQGLGTAGNRSAPRTTSRCTTAREGFLDAGIFNIVSKQTVLLAWCITQRNVR